MATGTLTYVMMKSIIFTISMLVTVFIASGQSDEGIWPFGNYYSLDFSTNPPTLRDTVFMNGQHRSTSLRKYHQSIAVTNNTGQLLFAVHLQPTNALLAPDNIFDRNENPIAGTSLMSEMPATGLPVVIPHPGNANQYYIFYVRSGGLLYSLFDMTLNGGLGNIVPGQKNVLISGYGTVLGPRMTAIQGCNGVWLVIRKTIENKYLSFHVGQTGINPQPVVSEVGLLPILSYDGIVGMMKSSPDGKTLVFASHRLVNNIVNDQIPGAVELYDFEKCSGKITDPRLLDTGKSFYGVCFSPDNTRFYVTQNDTVSGTGMAVGKVFQYNMTLPNLIDIVNSKTMILENLPTIQRNNNGMCDGQYRYGLGDMKIGPDGKIYLPNQSEQTCLQSVNPAISNPGMAIHVIHQPNNLGPACNPEINAIYNSINGMYCPDYFKGNFPRDIIRAPFHSPDTLTGSTINVVNCYRDSLVLSAVNDKACYFWDNGSTEQSRTVYGSGKYYVHYSADCHVTVDIYHVNFVHLPEIAPLQFGCPAMITLKIAAGSGNQVVFNYQLIDENGNLCGTQQGADDISFTGLTDGNYKLQISTELGCDTTIDVKLEAYPAPILITNPMDSTIHYGDSIQLHATGAIYYIWSPMATLDSPTKANPVARPLKPTEYMVIGLNEYGCRDTGYVKINIDYYMPDMIPNAFSPNGDGINDVFRLEGATYQKVRDFNIYNRYGQRVFTTRRAQLGWDGTFQNKPCDPGTYYYLIQLDYPDGKTKTLKGDVHLIR
jgi:gliding motility-associated-like protein